MQPLQQFAQQYRQPLGRCQPGCMPIPIQPPQFIQQPFPPQFR
jgi:hypothetical protein